MGKRKIQEFYSAIDEIADKEAFLESVREDFWEIADPRATDNQSYRLLDLLIIILCAILAGANTITDTGLCPFEGRDFSGYPLPGTLNFFKVGLKCRLKEIQCAWEQVDEKARPSNGQSPVIFTPMPRLKLGCFRNFSR